MATKHGELNFSVRKLRHRSLKLNNDDSPAVCPKPVSFPTKRKIVNDENRKCMLKPVSHEWPNKNELPSSPRKIFGAETPENIGNKFSPSKIPLYDTENSKPEVNKVSPRKLQLFSPNVKCYQKARQMLSHSSSNELVGRAKELGFLSSFISDHISKQIAGSLYVSGAPGTGKTACVNHVLKDVQQSEKIKTISINCMKLQNSSSIFKTIAEELKISPIPKSLRDIQKSVLDKLLSKGSYIIIVLDEMDHLESKHQDVLYTIFEWPSLPNSRLLLIGIANALDLTDRVLPRLQARQNCKPTLLHFQPYSREQITSILETRLKECLIDGQPILKPSALQFCARKISSVSGDIRKALDVCRRATELVEIEVRKQPVLKATSDDRCNPGSPKKHLKTSFKSVEITQIISVLNKVYGQQSTGNESCSGLPLQQKFLICTLLLLARKGNKKEVTVGKLHEVYCHICKRRQVSVIDHVELLNLCYLIESRGIITIRKNKEARLTKVSLRLDQGELEHTLQDKTLIASILEDKDCLVKK